MRAFADMFPAAVPCRGSREASLLRNGAQLFLRGEEFAGLKDIQNLAPGDFRTVRQEQFYLGGGQTNPDRIAALKEECALKKDGNKSSKIGF